jgi:hypothetical protein
MKMGERPTGVAVLSILVIIFSILQIISGIFLAFIMTTGIIIPVSGAYLIPGIIVIVIAVFWLIAGIGLWMLQNWARILAIIFGILGIIGGIILVLVGLSDIIVLLIGVIQLLISLVVVIYLFQEDVAAYFT